MSAFRISRLVAMISLSSLLPVFPVATATAAPALMDSLRWGIRSSFNSYTNGPTFVHGGATQPDPGNYTFTFPLKDYSFDATREHTEAQFEGEVVYRKYCNGQDGSDLNVYCDLDLSIKDPKVVIDKEGSYLYATVSSRQYLKNEVYSPNEPVAIGKLATAGGIFAANKAEGTISWEDIPVSLTAEGVKTFSNFYREGGSLDAISFSTHGEGQRLSSDRSNLRAESGEWISPKDYDSARHNLYQHGNKALVAVTGEGLHIVDPQLGDRAQFAAPLATNGVNAFDADHGYFYYTKWDPHTHDGYRQGFSSDLFRVKVTATGFGQEERLGSTNNPIFALAVHHQTGRIVAISVAEKPQSFDIPVDERTAELYIVDPVTGTLSAPLTLPNTSTLLGAAVTDETTAYAPTFFAGFTAPRLLSMDDGSFIYHSLAAPRLKDSDRTLRNILVHINPDDPAHLAEYLPASTSYQGTQVLEGIATDGERIIRWDKNDDAQYSLAESLRYQSGRLTQVRSPQPVDSVVGISGATFDSHGHLVVVDGVHSKLVWINPDTLERLEQEGDSPRDFSIRDGNGLFEVYQDNLLALSDGSFFIPTYRKGIDEKYQLIRLRDESREPLSAETAEEKALNKLKEQQRISLRIAQSTEEEVRNLQRAHIQALKNKNEVEARNVAARLELAINSYNEAKKAYEEIFGRPYTPQFPDMPSIPDNPTPLPHPDDQDSSGLSGGAIAGIVIGVLAIIAAIIGVAQHLGLLARFF
ncbi:HtaA domain-containing protein [Corynebacterium sp. ES2794-CONJ1]|uniref:HtaA domain-containing protein n=1 Tax=Corynebacterium sp. ES2794-CONJ1 TaxID=2980553 RepID=UPI0021DAE135|nr:HtaA domain-containing protein [Corynebacterium sp. ES2794-CONJ1]MCU9518908.1 HtaA domain-containing protein [Corynebacterium sp. ES2794-CONJ1]